MRDLTATQISRMADAQEVYMMDKCLIARRERSGVWSADMQYQIDDGVLPGTEPTDRYGNPAMIEDWEYAEYDCGFDPTGERELGGDSNIEVADALLRLPKDAEDDLQEIDLIIVTERFGVALSPEQVFEVMGRPARGPSGLVLRLKSVTDGSVRNV